ncbi:hypothetical protein [Frigidibacter sp. ROC022]|uniref:hypothetical protein n=1 Tax=Frigidibacter sp. ROC022 TaxID=2971796 RepID=UPI00215AE861|nr:hypothetical protein [Frigidibacter sp. ROC022]MCR8725431.1 hypothetical protein [Frigidibacter sp. ROC022]
MKSFTLDWNCALAVEAGEEQGAFVRRLVELHRRGLADVAITTVSASESLKGSKKFPASAAQFRKRITNLGWDDLRLLLGPAVVGLTYLNMCKNVGETFDSERQAIWQALAPSVDRRLPDGIEDQELWSPKLRKWRNVWCDTHTLWTHIDSGRDVFVTTNTKDFHANHEKLKLLGLRDVATPEVAVDLV